MRINNGKKTWEKINIIKEQTQKNKHGKADIVRSFKNLKRKYEKTSLDIAFMKSCKQKDLLATFAKVRL